ncbi:EcsC family protein [Gammaproteobacteria bacterium ESL0073]|nr:EcsC family protein [Gammaproteobacteria bacterium ESL0073]
MSEKRLTQEKILSLLNWAYDKVISGYLKFDSAEQLAQSFKDHRSTNEQVNSLIRWQNTKSATVGFITGSGGVFTLPVAVPANFATILLIQIRMIAAIAHLNGHDIKDEKVRTLVYIALCGNSVKSILKKTGINLGTKVTATLIQKYLTLEMIAQINKSVGFKLLTKTSTSGVINLGKAVPVVGGLIGGGFDAITTNLIGNAARDIFVKEQLNTSVDREIIPYEKENH